MYRVMVYTQKPRELPKLHSQSFGLTKEQAEQFANRVKQSERYYAGSIIMRKIDMTA